MFLGPVKALFSLNFYTKYIQQPWWKALLFVVYLFLISGFVMALGTFMSGKAPINAMITKVAQYMPEMVFANGKVSVNNDAPLVINPPELAGYKIVFETGRTEPVYPTQMATDNTILLVTDDTLYTSFQNKFQNYEIPDDINTTFNAQTLENNRTTITTFILYFMSVLVILLQFIKIPFILLMAFLAAMLMNSFARANATPGKILKLACYLQAPVTVLAILNFISPIKIPAIFVINLIIFAIYSYLVFNNIVNKENPQQEEAPQLPQEEQDDTEDKTQI